MSNYTKSTNFATKDNLPTGDPLKIVKGTEIDTEFNNISTAISTKTDNSAAAITGGSITGITDLAIADGGTGASTATAALNNLLPSQTSNANKYLQTDGTNASWDAVSLSTSDITGTLPVANGGTGVTSSTGTGSVVLSNSPTLVTPDLGTPAFGVATNLTGLPLSTGIIGLGTGVATALAINTPNTGAIVVNGGALGTPSSGTVTNLTGTASININGQVGSSTPNSGAFTTLSASSTVTISGGTANGVAYLNGSKVLTTGSIIKFDGTNFTSDRSASTAYSGTNQATWANGIVLNNSATPATGILDSIYFSNNANMQNVFGVAQNASGYGDFVWAGYAGTYTEWMKLTSSGLTLTSNPTLSGGTANGVTYLNGSKVLTSGSALTFDGTNLGNSQNTASPIGLVLNNASASTSAGTRVLFQYAGSTTTGYILNQFDGSDFNNKYQAAQFHIWLNGANETMRLTSTGLGIGTSSPSAKLHVVASTTAAVFDRTDGNSALIEMRTSGTLRGYLGAAASVPFAVYSTGAAELMRLDSAGNLGLGVTPSAWSGFTGLQVGALGGLNLGGAVDDNFVGSNVYYNSGWYFARPTTATYASMYRQTGGQHRFYTSSGTGTAGNGITWSQALTLTADGDLCVATTAKVYEGKVSVSFNGNAGSGDQGIALIDTNASLNGDYALFVNSSGNVAGRITHNGTTTVAYTTSSDYRLKDITGPITTSGAYIDSLNPVEGTWKSDGSTFVGLIAHEVQEASRTPIATGTKDGEEMQAMDYSSSELIANLIAEVKSLRQRVATLEAQ